MNNPSVAAVEDGGSVIDRLKAKALSLPAEPGVYLMSDQKGKIIYIGKAKRLKNRVSSYFQDNAGHSAKTRRMVARVRDFDTIVAASEFEALVLECSLIRYHRPRYNIRLKDGKGYPFIRLSPGAYPSLSVVHELVKDGSRYFGPYGGWGLSKQVIDALNATLHLPVCKKSFPREIGRGRPCLQYHMNRCIGVCLGEVSEEQFNERIRRAVMMMEGKTAGLVAELEADMHAKAEALMFEAAAQIRDEIKSVTALGNRQIVVGGGMADTDVIAAVAGETRSGAAVLHYLGGNLVGRDTEVSEDTDDTPEEYLSAFVTQYYMARGRVPRTVLLSHPIEDETLLRDVFLGKGMKVEFVVPKRGDKLELVKMAARNAAEEIERITTREEKTRYLLSELKRILSLPQPPERIEAIDMSHTGDSERVGVIICYKGGKPLKKAYRHFIVKNKEIHDDYHSMEEVLTRRFTRLARGEEGFDEAPDLLLVDGGSTHAAMAARVLAGLELNIPVFGMVKDEKHRTRAVVSPEGAEAALTGSPGVFALIGQIQEETHRSALAFHKKRRSRIDSELDGIAGLGEKRREALIHRFGSVKKIALAKPEELEEVLPKHAAAAVYNHFHVKYDISPAEFEGNGE